MAQKMDEGQLRERMAYVMRAMDARGLNRGTSGNVSARVGSHDLSDLRGGFRAGGERWGLRLNAQRLRTDNYRDNNRSELDTASGELRFGDRDGFVADVQRMRQRVRRDFTQAVIDNLTCGDFHNFHRIIGPGAAQT